MEVGERGHNNVLLNLDEPCLQIETPSMDLNSFSGLVGR